MGFPTIATFRKTSVRCVFENGIGMVKFWSDLEHVTMVSINNICGPGGESMHICCPELMFDTDISPYYIRTCFEHATFADMYGINGCTFTCSNDSIEYIDIGFTYRAHVIFSAYEEFVNAFA